MLNSKRIIVKFMSNYRKIYSNRRFALLSRKMRTSTKFSIIFWNTMFESIYNVLKICQNEKWQTNYRLYTSNYRKIYRNLPYALLSRQIRTSTTFSITFWNNMFESIYNVLKICQNAKWQTNYRQMYVELQENLQQSSIRTFISSNELIYKYFNRILKQHVRIYI